MERFLPWFALKDVPGIGNLLYKRLIERFGSPESVKEASPEALLQVEGMTPRLVEALKTYRVSDRIKRELDRISAKRVVVVTFTDPDYPPLLRESPDPPPYLYVSGHLGNTTKSISVVGSRNATTYGISMTERLCQSLVELGLTIVSGMARGIDTAAHLGALIGNGITIAVMGSGLDRIYPSENRKLFQRISEKGAVITEFPLQTEPEAHHFPVRNRIISGISLGTVIVEATKNSGSLITARLAAEQNREVFAVPGSVHSFKSIGAHNLIKQGAKLVEQAQDIIEEIGPGLHLQPSPPQPKHPPASLSPEEERVFQALEPYPVHIDDLIRKIGMEPGKLASTLMRLELKGLIDQAPGKRFSLTNDPN